MKNRARWTTADLADQSGRVAIVTGANAGLGLETARVLAGRGATVILACRSLERGGVALERIRADDPPGEVRLAHLDLASLASVRTFAESFGTGHARLDLLINNAGVMFPPLALTEDGFELQFGVNYLGHFALTGHLIDRLRATPGSRVVTLSSIAHRGARIDFESFRGDGRYRPVREYRQSKLACLMFALELRKRLEERGSSVLSLGAHPGGTRTELQRHNPVVDAGARLLGMHVSQGALPQLYAATAEEATDERYVGPGGFLEWRGYPGPAGVDEAALDEEMRERLWNESEALTGLRFP